MNGGRWVGVRGQRSPTASDAARITATEHAYRYGSGRYGTLHTCHAGPFALKEHLKRLAEDVTAMEFAH